MGKRNWIIVLLLGCFCLAAGFGSKKAKLQAFDVVCLPEQTVSLVAKLERVGAMGINPDVHSETLLFALGEKTLGTAKTGDDGLAELTWTAPKVSQNLSQTVELSVRLAGESEFENLSAPLHIYIRPATRKTILVDLDGTVCLASSLDVARENPQAIAEFPGSPQVLHELARQYDLIYLSARDDALFTVSKQWLLLKNFPSAPVLVRDIKMNNLSAKHFKTQRIAELKKHFNLYAGIGDRNEDAEAYLANGLLAFLVGDEEKIPTGTRKLVTWEEVLKLLSVE